jgi:hypothetical protein
MQGISPSLGEVGHAQSYTQEDDATQGLSTHTGHFFRVKGHRIVQEEEEEVRG